MPLAPGTHVGPYEIAAPLGAGGMGEVYRARDTRLERSVAIKILPEQFAQDAQQLARLQREAQLLAALNHPNIAAIYGLEESDSTRALVMELVEGPTLADRIAQGRVPIEEALPIAAQVAEALEYAHERGIIHRDLKPANVKLTRDGDVKILDFGLAKALEEPGNSADIATSPTLSLAATHVGFILGTAAYMSPEQAKGKPVDRRADIWAFGVILHEMLTGKPLYSGETTSEILAAVIMKEPSFEALPAATPAPILALLRRCLTKDPRQRLRDIGEARILIADYLANPVAASAAFAAAATQVAAQPLWRRSLPWATAAVLGIALVATLVLLYRAARPTPTSLMRLSIDLGDEVVGTDWGSGVAISPGGSRLAFVSRSPDGIQRLLVRALDSAKATPLPGTENAQGPFFSPDGQWVAFFANGKLKKIATQGGAPETLCDAPSTRGGSWAEDGNIIFAASNRSPLSRVSSAGGAPQLVTQLNGAWTHRFPQVLPGAEAFLFTSCQALDLEACAIEAQSLSTGQHKILVRGGYYGRYLTSGHLMYMHQGAAFAAPMNLKRLELTGPASPVLEDVSTNVGTGVAQFDFSRSGTAVYIPGKALPPMTIFWLDATGNLKPLGIEPRTYRAIRVSPDGTRLALEIAEGSQSNVWVYDWAGTRLSRLTFLNGNSRNPVWTPDSKHLVFYNDGQAPGPGIYWIRADGAGEAQRLLEGNGLIPGSFSPDGKWLTYDSPAAGRGSSIWTLQLDGGNSDLPKASKPHALTGLTGTEVGAAFSPDGRWIAYISAESGLPEVYVRSFSGPGGRWLVSSRGSGVAAGGFSAFWSQNGRELFYTSPAGEIIAVSYTANGETFSASQPRLWSSRRVGGPIGFPTQGIDLAPDGKRFAAILPAAREAEPKPQTHVVFLLNFFDELRRRVPSARE